MALTDRELAEAIRAAADFDELEPAVQGIIRRLNRACRVFVEAHTNLAPEDITDEAIIRMAGYLFDAPNVTRFGVAFRESGAMSLVDPWKVRGAPVLGAEQAATIAPGALEVRISISRNQQLTEVEALAGTVSHDPDVIFPHAIGIDTPPIDGPFYMFVGVPETAPDPGAVVYQAGQDQLPILVKADPVAGFKWWRWPRQFNLRGRIRHIIVFPGGV